MTKQENNARKKSPEKQEKKLNLHQKLIEIRKEIPYLQKNEDGFNYKYVKGSILLGLLRPKMDELGILLSYDVSEMHTENVERQVFDKKTKTYRQIQTGRVKMKYIFSFTNAEDPKDCWNIGIWMQGIGDDIQSIGGYNTYALRYFLLGFFNIPTDKADPDTFDNSIEAAKPTECIDSNQIAEIKKLINGHDDILINMLDAYKIKAIESVPAANFDFIISVINKRIADKEKKNESKV